MIHSIKSSIKRNLDGYPFCPGLNQQQRFEVMNKIKVACEKLKLYDKNLEGTFKELKDLSEPEKLKLGDHVFSITDPF